MGATQANAKGAGTFSWHHPEGSYFSPQGQLDPRKGQPLPFWWPTCHNLSQFATAVDMN